MGHLKAERLRKPRVGCELMLDDAINLQFENSRSILEILDLLSPQKSMRPVQRKRQNRIDDYTKSRKRML